MFFKLSTLATAGRHNVCQRVHVNPSTFALAFSPFPSSISTPIAAVLFRILCSGSVCSGAQRGDSAPACECVLKPLVRPLAANVLPRETPTRRGKRQIVTCESFAHVWEKKGETSKYIAMTYLSRLRGGAYLGEFHLVV